MKSVFVLRLDADAACAGCIGWGQIVWIGANLTLAGPQVRRPMSRV